MFRHYIVYVENMRLIRLLTKKHEAAYKSGLDDMTALGYGQYVADIRFHLQESSTNQVLADTSIVQPLFRIRLIGWTSDRLKQ